MKRLLWAAGVVVLAGCGGGVDPWDGNVRTHGGSGGSASPSAAPRLPEISGGTVTVVGGRFAMVSDADRSRLWVVDLEGPSLRNSIALPAGSEPGRAVADDQGRLRVALRGTGEVLTVSPSSGGVLNRVKVCPEPRGLSFEQGLLRVACASGELATVDSNAKVTLQRLGGDLRDVVPTSKGLMISQFRSADMALLASGETTPKPVGNLPALELPAVDAEGSRFVPKVAWRTVSLGGDQVLTVQQVNVEGDIAAIQVPANPAPAYYQNTCNASIVRSMLTVRDPNGHLASTEVRGTLPVDVAVSPDRAWFAVAMGSSNEVAIVPATSVTGIRGGSRCATFVPGQRNVPVGQATGVAFTPKGELLVHTREPAQLIRLSPAPEFAIQATLLLDAASKSTQGHGLFHQAVGQISCASCHPEGRDDGHVWTLAGGTHRTQVLNGGLMETLPFHWAGNFGSMEAVLDETFVLRMGGSKPQPETVTALSDWMNTLPPARMAVPVDGESVAQGKAVFEGAVAGCGTCHSGKALTNNQTVDVGTGGRYQVPSLRGVGQRGPWLHDGSAATLEGAIKTARHGRFSDLSPSDRAALLAYVGQL